MLSRAFGSFAKQRPLDLSIPASTALLRAFDSHLLYHSKSSQDRSAQSAAGFRRCSHILQQVHQLHHQPVPPDSFPQEQHPLGNNSRGARTCIFGQTSTASRSFNQRLATVRSIGECVSDVELIMLLKEKTDPICYVWCEPSPWMHLTQGISMVINVNKLVKAGCRVKILMADWFAQMDCKISGNLSKVQTIGRYNMEMLKASGMDLDGVEFVQLSDEISRHADKYWSLAMDIARRSNLSEIKRCFSVHASKDRRDFGSTDTYMVGELTPAETLYACLQSAVMLIPEVDIWLLGMDQHGSDMLAREYFNTMQWKNKPIALFHNMAPDLLQDPEWEEWGDPRWPIFMEDDEEDVSRKLQNAFCPLKFAEDNPCLDYIKYIILPWFGKFEVLRKEKNGGNKIFLSMEQLTADYQSGALHPADVKQALVKAVNMVLQPVRDHFRSSAEAIILAKAMKETATQPAQLSAREQFVSFYHGKDGRNKTRTECFDLLSR